MVSMYRKIDTYIYIYIYIDVYIFCVYSLSRNSPLQLLFLMSFQNVDVQFAIEISAGRREI